MRQRPAFAYLALAPVVLGGASRTIVINGGAETYKVVYDDARVPDSEMRQYLLLSPYVNTIEDYDMAMSSSVDANGKEKVDKINKAYKETRKKATDKFQEMMTKAMREKDPAAFRTLGEKGKELLGAITPVALMRR